LKALRIIKAIKPFEVSDITPSFREGLDPPLTEEDKKRDERLDANLSRLIPLSLEQRIYILLSRGYQHANGK
jgi:hypothetical protein